MNTNIVLRRLVRFNNKSFKELNALLLQLSLRGYQMTASQLKLAVRNKNNHILVLRNKDGIIGTATLVALHQLTGNKGYIEDVVVDKAYRGRGLGRKLVTEVIARAKKLGIDSLELKSEQYRTVANILYQHMGFELKEANVYAIKLRT